MGPGTIPDNPNSITWPHSPSPLICSSFRAQMQTSDQQLSLHTALVRSWNVNEWSG